MYQSLQRFLNRGRAPIVTSQKTTKEEFLSEHNKLSPLNLQATTALLLRFKTEKATLFKDNNWSIDKLRRPFIMWLTSLTLKERENKWEILITRTKTETEETVADFWKNTEIKFRISKEKAERNKSRKSPHGRFFGLPYLLALDEKCRIRIYFLDISANRHIPQIIFRPED